VVSLCIAYFSNHISLINNLSSVYAILLVCFLGGDGSPAVSGSSSNNKGNEMIFT